MTRVFRKACDWSGALPLCGGTNTAGRFGSISTHDSGRFQSFAVPNSPHPSTPAQKCSRTRCAPCFSSQVKPGPAGQILFATKGKELRDKSRGGGLDSKSSDVCCAAETDRRASIRRTTRPTSTGLVSAS